MRICRTMSYLVVLAVSGCTLLPFLLPNPTMFQTFRSADALKAKALDLYAQYGERGSPVPAALPPDQPVLLPDATAFDGAYLYAVRDRKLQVIAATPGDAMHVAASIDLDRPAQSVYLAGSRIAVISCADSGFSTDVISAHRTPWAPGQSPNTLVRVYDVATPSDPRFLAQYEFQAKLCQVRPTGSGLVLLTTPQMRVADDGDLNLEQMLPQMCITDAQGRQTQGPAFGWQDVLYPETPSASRLIAVTMIDLANQNAAPQTRVVMGTEAWVRIYDSAFYLIPQGQTYPLYPNEVHKFELADSGPDYVAAGLLPEACGIFHDANEEDGRLRIVTLGVPETGEPEVRLLVAEQDGNRMQVVGQADVVDPGRYVQTSLFAGNRLALFLRSTGNSDPDGDAANPRILMVDLSDPHQPAPGAELAVPAGHYGVFRPYDAAHILWREYPSSATGTTPGEQKLQILDVSDPARLTVAQEAQIAGPGHAASGFQIAGLHGSLLAGTAYEDDRQQVNFCRVQPESPITWLGQVVDVDRQVQVFLAENQAWLVTLDTVQAVHIGEDVKSVGSVVIVP